MHWLFQILFSSFYAKINVESSDARVHKRAMTLSKIKENSNPLIWAGHYYVWIIINEIEMKKIDNFIEKKITWTFARRVK